SDSFEISFSGIAAMLKYGKDKIKATVKNAEQAGYLVRTKKRSPAGTFEWDYYVFVSKADAESFRANHPDAYKPEFSDAHQGGQNHPLDEPPLDEPPPGFAPPHKKNMEDKGLINSSDF
ncbi:hypothetical protein, partial [Blastomonas sp. UPD001]|uniref:hypothetical protein n=1 Tax=Blastomonas sp. UPD001 TaxID=2217673 RepID=UPI0018E4E152